MVTNSTVKNVKYNLDQLFEMLDEKSRSILWHLWWHRYADITELRELINVVSDFEVLLRLKEVINRKAQELWGEAIVSFEESKIDPLTGEKILFCWWFMDGEDMPAIYGNKPLVDIFNEKETVTVIAQLPASVDLTHADINCKNNVLRIKMKKGG